MRRGLAGELAPELRRIERPPGGLITPRREHVRHDPEVGLCLALGSEISDGDLIDHVCCLPQDHDEGHDRAEHVCRCLYTWATTTPRKRP